MGNVINDERNIHCIPITANAVINNECAKYSWRLKERCAIWKNLDGVKIIDIEALR